MWSGGLYMRRSLRRFPDGCMHRHLAQREMPGSVMLGRFLSWPILPDWSHGYNMSSLLLRLERT